MLILRFAFYDWPTENVSLLSSVFLLKHHLFWFEGGHSHFPFHWSCQCNSTIAYLLASNPGRNQKTAQGYRMQKRCVQNLTHISMHENCLCNTKSSVSTKCYWPLVTGWASNVKSNPLPGRNWYTFTGKFYWIIVGLPEFERFSDLFKQFSIEFLKNV